MNKNYDFVDFKSMYISDFKDISDDGMIEFIGNLIERKVKTNLVFSDRSYKLSFNLLDVCCFYLKPKALEFLLKHRKNFDYSNSLLKLSMSAEVVKKNNPTETVEYWKNFEKCLSLIMNEENLDFNTTDKRGRKPLTILLRKEKTKIPEHILKLFIDKTEDENILSKIIYNKENFTYKNILYIVNSKKGIINNINDPEYSLQFIITGTENNLSVNDFKNLNFEMSLESSKDHQFSGLTAVEFAILEKDISNFDKFKKAFPDIFNKKENIERFFKTSLMFDFKYAIDFFGEKIELINRYDLLEYTISNVTKSNLKKMIDYKTISNEIGKNKKHENKIKI